MQLNPAQFMNVLWDGACIKCQAKLELWFNFVNECAWQYCEVPFRSKDATSSLALRLGTRSY